MNESRRLGLGQAHGSAVNASTTPKVQYGYADGSSDTIRPTTISYPNGRVVTYDYGSPNSIGDAVGRIASILDDDMSSTHPADYTYLRSSTFIEVDYTEPDIKCTMVGKAGGNDPDTGDIYLGSREAAACAVRAMGLPCRRFATRS